MTTALDRGQGGNPLTISDMIDYRETKRWSSPPPANETRPIHGKGPTTRRQRARSFTAATGDGETGGTLR